MKVVYYTPGGTGAGRLVIGLSIGNAFNRNSSRVEFSIISSSPFSFLAESQQIPMMEIPIEYEDTLTGEMFAESALYNAITSSAPDVLIIDLAWYMVHSFIDLLPCKKILLIRQVLDSYFSIPFPDEIMNVKPENYDRIFTIEKFSCTVPHETLDPMIILNRDEILNRSSALDALGLTDSKGKYCFLYMNGKEGEFEESAKSFAYLQEAGWNMVSSTNYSREGIFPAPRYFDAFDLLVCSGGYNSFWEAAYFEKEAIFIPYKRRFEDQNHRIQNCKGYRGFENGADQLAEIITNM